MGIDGLNSAQIPSGDLLLSGDLGMSLTNSVDFDSTPIIFWPAHIARASCHQEYLLLLPVLDLKWGKHEYLEEEIKRSRADRGPLVVLPKLLCLSGHFSTTFVTYLALPALPNLEKTPGKVKKSCPTTYVSKQFSKGVTRIQR